MTENITIVGNVASEPRHAVAASGVAHTQFRIACGSRVRDRESGEWRDGETSFYSVTAFRSLAEHAAASFRTGDRIIVAGRLRVREWTDGERRGTTAEIDAEALGHDLRWGTTTFHRARRPNADTELDANGFPETIAEPMALDDAVPTPF